MVDPTADPGRTAIQVSDELPGQNHERDRRIAAHEAARWVLSDATGPGGDRTHE